MYKAALCRRILLTLWIVLYKNFLIMSITIEINRLLADPEKRRAWVAFQLKLKGETFTGLARRIGVSRQAVRQAMYRPYPRMEKVIAEVLGLKPQVLFPERYDTEGLSLRRMGRPKKSLVNGSKFAVKCKQKKADNKIVS